MSTIDLYREAVRRLDDEARDAILRSASADELLDLLCWQVDEEPTADPRAYLTPEDAGRAVARWRADVARVARAFVAALDREEADHE